MCAFGDVFLTTGEADLVCNVRVGASTGAGCLLGLAFGREPCGMILPSALLATGGEDAARCSSSTTGDGEAALRGLSSVLCFAPGGLLASSAQPSTSLRRRLRRLLCLSAFSPSDAARFVPRFREDVRFATSGSWRAAGEEPLSLWCRFSRRLRGASRRGDVRGDATAGALCRCPPPAFAVSDARRPRARDLRSSPALFLLPLSTLISLAGFSARVLPMGLAS
mmetsp:Transcript_111858/g.174720  ORF Transcript_111858/g.174720 Transcript_111858/m.174720 type:complete len:223 (-) Transcript_111858:336-1004(-)